LLKHLQAEKKGWLTKQGMNQMGTWQRRWFVVANNCVYYFDRPEVHICNTQRREAERGKGRERERQREEFCFTTLHSVQ
jgi:hypothetical protein